MSGDFDQLPQVSGFRLPAARRRGGSGLMLKGVIKFFKARPKIDSKLCKHCQTCVDSCPVQAIDAKTKQIDYNKCIECLCCHELCLHRAVNLKRENPAARWVLPLAGMAHKDT